MNLILLFALILTLNPAAGNAAESVQANRARLDRIQQTLSTEVPRVLCLDNDFATGAQPVGDAYAKAAATGFRSVLSLRTANEGLDLANERAKVESVKMRYLNSPVVSSAPQVQQADEFLRLTRDKSNYPMLVTCASANRVGAFMMILRVVDQGWSEDKALQEAVKIGLTSDRLKRFAQDYIAAHRGQRK